jgi:hypothetical protein
MKLSLRATMLTGGIPVWRNVKAKTTQESLEAEHVVRIHDRKSPEPIVEILQHDVDYSFLGAEMAPASLANLNTIVDRMASMFPHAVFDDRLTRHPVAGVPSSRLLDDFEVNCRLVYLCHLSRTGADGDA